MTANQLGGPPAPAARVISECRRITFVAFIAPLLTDRALSAPVPFRFGGAGHALRCPNPESQPMKLQFSLLRDRGLLAGRRV
jgi:hypothetical protein